MKYISLFKTFMKIGIVTFGGGYAMIPIIESQVVKDTGSHRLHPRRFVAIVPYYLGDSHVFPSV